jgi:hypothetical protein
MYINIIHHKKFDPKIPPIVLVLKYILYGPWSNLATNCQIINLNIIYFRLRLKPWTFTYIKLLMVVMLSMHFSFELLRHAIVYFLNYFGLLWMFFIIWKTMNFYFWLYIFWSIYCFEAKVQTRYKELATFRIVS